MSNQRSRQVGGDHYQKYGDYQPVHVIEDFLDNDFKLGSAFKYMCRWQDKGGVQDLQKALHFLALKIDEVEEA